MSKKKGKANIIAYQWVGYACTSGEGWVLKYLTKRRAIIRDTRTYGIIPLKEVNGDHISYLSKYSTRILGYKGKSL